MCRLGGGVAVSGEIRNPEAYIRAALRRRTERFDHLFPRGITLGDIDSFCEINGHFLVIEWKLEGQEIPTGQRIAYNKLAELKQFFVLVVWTDEEGQITSSHVMGFGIASKQDCDEEHVSRLVGGWIRHADLQLYGCLACGV